MGVKEGVEKGKAKMEGEDLSAQIKVIVARRAV